MSRRGWANAFAQGRRIIVDFPDTYEKLVALLRRQHPDWSLAEVERYIRAAQQAQAAPRRPAP
jgi:hypothetical protein